MFGAAKVGVDLAGEDGVLGDVCVAGVLVKREEQKPCDAYYDEQGGEVGWELEQDRGAAEGEEARCCNYTSVGVFGKKYDPLTQRHCACVLSQLHCGSFNVSSNAQSNAVRDI